MTDPIPDSLRRFILLNIDSVELLNVLLLLHQHPSQSFTLQEIEKSIRSSLTAIQKRLDDLYARKILDPIPGKSDQHRYLPHTDEIALLIDALATHYQTYSNRIIELIFSRQNEALRSFADAFRIKKDE
jgi:hypothetical protein